MVITVAFTGTCTFVVQMFMIGRYWRLTSHHVISLVIVAFAIASLVGTYLTAAVTYTKQWPPHWRKRLAFVVLGLGGAAATDILITVLLVWKFRSIETEIQATKSLLRRLSVNAITTGLATTIVACATFISFSVNPQSQVSDGILYIIGRVYTCTMLFTLNSRGRASRESAYEVGVSLPSNTGNLPATAKHGPPRCAPDHFMLSTLKFNLSNPSSDPVHLSSRPTPSMAGDQPHSSPTISTSRSVIANADS